VSVRPLPRAIPDNLADIVGNTPMVRLTRIAPDCGAELIGKLEAYNPAGSVKDRIGVAMIAAAEAEGRIEPGRNTIVESTSGNTGIALAFVCAARGYDLVITMPQGMSREREKLLRLYGAEVVWVESMGGMNEAVEEARRICRERGDCYVPPIPRFTGAPPPRRSGGTRTAPWTCWSPPAAPVARSPAAASG
jgi:cysteine synthase